MAMNVEINGNKLCIEIDLEKPTPSASGKTLVVASTRGNAVTPSLPRWSLFSAHSAAPPSGVADYAK
jgi:hypothetical protein